MMHQKSEINEPKSLKTSNQELMISPSLDEILRDDTLTPPSQAS